jgi:2-polyprenyl-6-methoxyphenol hydroxylase-like FAD-dependent oxidoreductase
MMVLKYSLRVYALLQLINISLTVAFSTTPSTNQQIQCVDCAIIGGGPAGLTASIAISKAAPSASIAIYERDNFQPKGATIIISDDGWESIKEMDPILVNKLKKTRVAITSLETKPWRGKEVKAATYTGSRLFLKKIKDTLSKIWLKIGIASSLRLLFKGAIRYAHLWHDVRTVLAARAKDVYPAGRNNPLLNPNCSLDNIQTINTSGETGARFAITVNENGQPKTVHAKLVIACDGSMSRVRSLLPNEPDILIDEQKSVWRGLTPKSANGKATFRTDKDTGRSAVLFPAGKGAGASWTVISHIQAGKSETQAQARSRLAKVIHDVDEDFKQAVDDSPFIIENKLFVRDFDKPWNSSYDGLAFAGDAAHPVRPTGEGIALALEDAKVLGEVVAKHGLGVEALRAYEDERFEPVKTISKKVRKEAQESITDNRVFKK